MAKVNVNDPLPKTAPPEVAAKDDTTKKPRAPRINYTVQEFPPVLASNGKPSTNPADKPLIVIHGGIKFDGMILEDAYGEAIIKVPALAKVFKNPSLRQLVAELDKLHTETTK